MKKLNIAVIGQGRSGRDIHGKFFKSEKNTTYTVKYVVELDAERRERAEKEYPECTALSDYRELFAIKDIDLVVNASFSDMHYPITKDLLQHGFNVVVEKPFARNYYECCDLIETAKENGVMLAVFQQTFFAPIYTKTAEVVKSGILGDIMQVSVKYNGFARRWDWQTIQERLAGSVYNTGPHPIGIALGLIDFAPDTRVVYSKLGKALASGDAEDFAKIILAAKDKPVVDIEISSIDAYSPYNIKILGTKGTYVTTGASYKMKYIVDGENPERPLTKEPLKNENGMPMYCSEKLITHEEENKHDGSAFDVAVEKYYAMVYARLTEGTPLALDPSDMAMIVSVMETVHAQNPMPKTVKL
jgi:predicted dehydrogenase